MPFLRGKVLKFSVFCIRSFREFCVATKFYYESIAMDFLFKLLQLHFTTRLFLFEQDVIENRDKKNKESTRAYRQYACKVKFGDKEYYVRSTIRVDNNGNYYYDINFDNLEVIKKGPTFNLTSVNKTEDAKGDPSFSANMLSLWLKEVNTLKKLLAGDIQWSEADKSFFEHQKENVRERYEGTNRWLKAPSGKESNLNEEQWTIVRTPLFKKWFGQWENKKYNKELMLDENGEPIIYNNNGVETFMRVQRGQDITTLSEEDILDANHPEIDKLNGTFNLEQSDNPGTGPRLAKGSVVYSQNISQRIVNLFDIADQSTAMHEMAHLYLLDLQELAGIAGPDSQYAKDLQTIMAWAGWKAGQVNEYTGTASAQEFLERDAAIRAALKAGNTAEAEELQNVWAQERFARGFEEYLYKGQAPTTGLRKAFRTFKRWLGNIYKGYIGVGGRATPEVEAIMARIIASEEEIEAMAAADNIARLEKIDPDILESDAGRMLERWKEEAKEQAKEQLLQELLAEYKALDVEEHLKAYREQVQEDLQKHDCFMVQACVEDGDSLEAALAAFGYESKEVYEAELNALGGSYEKAVDNTVEAERERYKRTPVQQQDLYEKAREALSSGEHNTRLAMIEAELLERRKEKYNGVPEKVAKALHGVDQARASGKVERLKKQIQALKYAQRWKDAEYDLILDIERGLVASAEKAKAEEVLKIFDAKYASLKKATVQNKEWLRGVRDATLGKCAAIRNEAREQMADMPIAAATNFRLWHRKELQEGNKALSEITRAQNENTGVHVPEGKENLRPNIAEEHARAAERAKINQATFAAMTAEAIRIKRKIVTPILNKLKRRQKTMSGKHFKMDANYRYFHEHLLYVYGLRSADARPPVGSEARSFEAWLAERKEYGDFDAAAVPDLVRVAMATNDQLKHYTQLTYGELQALSDFCDLLYTLGKNENSRITDGVSMDQVEADCTKDYQATIDYHIGRQKFNDVKGAMGKYMASLMKTETMLSILGGKKGAFIKYIYETLANAADREERAREEEAKFIRGYDVKLEDGTKKHVQGLYERFYTKEELRKICNDALTVTDEDGKESRFQLGDDDRVTKEHIICMALNWGNATNRARLCNGLEMSEERVMELFQKFLTQNDWNFVQAMWDHIEEFGDPVSEVMEKLYGLPMKRVEAEAFTVDLGNGTGLKMRGGYYPIKYDPKKSKKQSEFEQMEEAMSMGGASVMGFGMGNTKGRAGVEYKGNGPLLLELGVAHAHIEGMLHIIHSKLPVRDAYKVVNNKLVAAQIEDTFGKDMYDMIKENVLSCWQSPIRPNELYESMAGKLRSRTISAIMKYRISTALLNFANVVYMSQEIGFVNTLDAVVDYYKNRSLNQEFVLNASVFMRNRATNMDRDLNAVADTLYAHHNAAVNKLADITEGKSLEAMHLIDKYANRAIEYTDMIFSMPLYYWQFKQTYNEELMKPGITEMEAREKANFEATRRVTKVFSSNRVIDTSAVQRSKNEIVRLFTPFFSFSNMMMNAVWSKYYEGKYQNAKEEMKDANGNVVRNPDGSSVLIPVEKGFKQRWGRFLAAGFVDFCIGSLVETALRRVPGVLAGGGGDDDEDWWKTFGKDWGKNAVQSAVGGLPIINLAVDPVAEFSLSYLVDDKISYKYNSRSSAGVIGGAADRVVQVGGDVIKLMKGSPKFDMLDMMRDVVRATNAYSGFSDTLVDALFNTARFATDEGYSLDNMDDLREYIAKTIFDRKLKKRN